MFFGRSPEAGSGFSLQSFLPRVLGAKKDFRGIYPDEYRESL